MRNSGARISGWYVIQVRTGQESRMCQIIEKACFEHDEAIKLSWSDSSTESQNHLVNLEECFSPRFRTQRKRKGEWQDVERPLLPGYVIADVANPVELAQVVRGILGANRVLASEETYAPLGVYEREWIESYTEKGERVVPMSFGHRDSDGTITVMQGPLKGCEGMITKVDRAHSLAHLEFQVGQIRVKTTVGLGIVPETRNKANHSE